MLLAHISLSQTRFVTVVSSWLHVSALSIPTPKEMSYSGTLNAEWVQTDPKENHNRRVNTTKASLVFTVFSRWPHSDCSCVLCDAHTCSRCFQRVKDSSAVHRSGINRFSAWARLPLSVSTGSQRLTSTQSCVGGFRTSSHYVKPVTQHSESAPQPHPYTHTHML